MISLNQKWNLKSYDMYIAYFMSHMWVKENIFNKWFICCISRMQKNEMPNPTLDAEFYDESNDVMHDRFW